MKKRQQGLTTVEAAIGAALMLIILFVTIEVSRAIFVWNLLDEVTRRAARVAAVCPFNHPGIREAAIFADKGDTQSPHVYQLTPSGVKIEYLDANGGEITGGADAFQNTSFVSAYIDGFDLPLLIFPTDLKTPQFRTTLPSESLGYNPDPGEGVCSCFDYPVLGGGDGCDW